MESQILVENAAGRNGNRRCGGYLDPGGADRVGYHIQSSAYQSGTDDLQQNYQRKRRDLEDLSGEITVFLSLVFLLLLSLAVALLDSASIQLAKNYRRTDVNRAVECMFAEYQKELLEEYGIFALDGSYETGSYEESNLIGRLGFYGGGSGTHRIRKIRFLTDEGGREFYQQAVRNMESRYGLDLVQDWLGTASLFQQQDSRTDWAEEEEKGWRQELQGLLEVNEAQLPQEENPIGHVSQMKQSPVLSLVVPKDQALSEKQIETEDLPSGRECQQGYGTFEETEGQGKLQDLLFGAYLLEHFHAFTDEEKTGPLDYELEYILEGEKSDRENLEAVVLKLMLLRFVPNYAYIQTDAGMKAEARAAAATLCSLLAVPAITEAAAQVILLAWAYGETVMDLRSLLGGFRIPLIKSRSSWQLTLPALLKLGTSEDSGAGRDHAEGFYYRDYLRLLLFLEAKEQSAIRALDLMEETLQSSKGLSFFRADQCVTRIQIQSEFRFRRGITYTFYTEFGYQ